jgi:uncharacterized membrane protein YfcA
MQVWQFTLLLGAGSFLAGFIGALTGLGGGVILIPMLVLLFHIDLHYALGASLVSVIATSSGAAASYVREGYTNVRIGMFLEMATTIGAMVGATLVATGLVPKQAIAVVFGLMLLVSAYLSRHPPADHTGEPADPLATRLRLDGTYPVGDGFQAYHVRGVPQGFGLMFVAGILSGLLGIGSGALKVLAMDQAMRIPFTVSTTTSNFMIGVTAAASAGIYLGRGYIDPALTMPVMLGVLAGSVLGARLLPSFKPRLLRDVFAVLLVLLAARMIWQGLTGEEL